jgi:hypothetical protein
MHGFRHGRRRRVILFADDHGRRYADVRQSRAEIGLPQHGACGFVGCDIVFQEDVDAALQNVRAFLQECRREPAFPLKRQKR